MRLRTAVFIYTGLLVLNVVLLNLVFRNVMGFGTYLLVYLACGFMLNRTVLRQLIVWHEMHNTITAVSSAKFWSLVLWPLSYGSLFVRLAINKWL